MPSSNPYLLISDADDSDSTDGLSPLPVRPAPPKKRNKNKHRACSSPLESPFASPFASPLASPLASPVTVKKNKKKKHPASAPSGSAPIEKIKPTPSPSLSVSSDNSDHEYLLPSALCAPGVSPLDNDSESDADVPLFKRSRTHAPAESPVPPSPLPPPPAPMSKSEGKKPMHPRPSAKRSAASAPPHLRRCCPTTWHYKKLELFVEHLRKKMDAVREFVHQREKEDNEAYETGTLPSWRDASGRETGSKLLNLANLLSTDRTFIPYAEFCDITHHESLLSVLGGTKSYHVAFVRRSNKETVTFDYVYEHLEELLRPIVTQSALFAARPEQVLAIAEKLAKYPVEIACSVRRRDRPLGHESTQDYVRHANTMPEIDLINYATGNGKTFAAIVAAMTELADPKQWAHHLATWRDSIQTNTVVPNLGFSKGVSLDGHALARVAVVLVPEGKLFNQWSKTADAVRVAMSEELDMDFIIWKGTHKLKRKTKTDPGVDGTLKDAHELTLTENKPLLWLVYAKTESAKKTVRAAPKLHIPIRMYDEMNCRTEPKSEGYESRVLRNVIVQATVERLETSTRNQKAHPLRKALGGQNFNPFDLSHAAIFHLATAPDWLRLMVSQGMRPLMPEGIRKVTLKVRLQSLAARVNKSDMNITSLEELLNSMLASVNVTAMSNGQRMAFLDRCRGILGQTAPAPGQEGMPIHARLGAARGEIQSDHDALPPEPRAPAPGVPIPQAELDAYRDISRQKRILTCMLRMLGNLRAAVCVDPPPECPITLCDIPKECVGIFSCCTNLFDVRATDQLSDRCPMCNAELDNRIIKATTAIGALIEAPQLPPPAAATATASGAGPSGEGGGEPLRVGDAKHLVDRLTSVTAKKTFTMSSKAVIETMREFLCFKPRGARILLAFSCAGQNGNGGMDGTYRMRQLLRDSIPGLDSVQTVRTNDASAAEAFEKDDHTNRVLFINTSDTSASLEGLDLWNTDVVIIDRLAGGNGVSSAKIVQAVGRAMRPQAKGAAARSNVLYDGPSPFPAKLTVLLERDYSYDGGSSDDDSGQE